MPLNLPNILTIARLIAAPMLALVFVLVSSPLADMIAFFLFITAAMVVIALALLLGLWHGNVWIVIPAVAILFREVFVSGLREFLGAKKDLLSVTKLAKWKTTAQMLAIGLILLAGVFQSDLQGLYYQMPPATYEAILAGEMADDYGLRQTHLLANGLSGAGLGLLWIAAVLSRHGAGPDRRAARARAALRGGFCGFGRGEGGARSRACGARCAAHGCARGCVFPAHDRRLAYADFGANGGFRSWR